MTTSTPDALTQIKDQHRAVWAAGSYADVAELIADAAPAQLLSHVGIEPGQSVLDVATGTGNVALEASGLGAHVIGTATTGGTTRLSFGPFLSVQDISFAADALGEIASKHSTPVAQPTHS